MVGTAQEPQPRHPPSLHVVARSAESPGRHDDEHLLAVHGVAHDIMRAVRLKHSSMTMLVVFF